MKRFLADAVLILILVGLGGYVRKQDSRQATSLNHEVEDFENAVAQHKPLSSKTAKVTLGDTQDNGASRMAKAGSTFIVNTMHGTVEMVSALFDSLIK